MKRVVCLLIMVAIFSSCFADEYEINNIPSTHYGIWIPKEFDKVFKNNCNYILAQRSNRDKKAHDILVISKNRIQSDLGFHDGYAIKQKEFNTFVLRMENNKPTMFDGDNNEYILISKSIENYTSVFVNYLSSEIGIKLRTYNTEKALYVKEGKLYIRSWEQQYGPFRLIPDLFVLSVNDIDRTKYCFVIFDENKRQYYGVSLDTTSVEIDAFNEKWELSGSTVSSNSIEIVRVFLMK